MTTSDPFLDPPQARPGGCLCAVAALGLAVAVFAAFLALYLILGAVLGLAGA